MEVKEYVKCSRTCQLHKPEYRKPLVKLQHTIISRPWKMLGVYINHGALSSKFNWRPVPVRICELLLALGGAFPLRHTTNETVCAVRKREILTRWGVPDFILSDQGSQLSQVCLNRPASSGISVQRKPPLTSPNQLHRTR